MQRRCASASSSGFPASSGVKLLQLTICWCIFEGWLVWNRLWPIWGRLGRTSRIYWRQLGCRLVRWCYWRTSRVYRKGQLNRLVGGHALMTSRGIIVIVLVLLLIIAIYILVWRARGWSSCTFHILK